MPSVPVVTDTSESRVPHMEPRINAAAVELEGFAAELQELKSQLMLVQLRSRVAAVGRATVAAAAELRAISIGVKMVGSRCASKEPR